MKTKSLLLFMLMALFAPWAANAQNSIPFNEGFESMTSVDDLTAAGWTLSTTESGTFLAIETTASNVYEGSKSLNLDAWNASSSSSVQYLGLPLVAGDLNTLQISFAYKVSSGTINVGYLTDATDFSTFTSLAQYSSSSSFTVVSTDLSEAPSDAARLVLKYTGWYRCYLDSFEVKVLPSCQAATSITASDVTTTSATIAWEGEGDTWNLKYNGIEVNGISAMSYNLTNLTDGTNYTVSVQNVCSDGTTTDWISTTFSTPEICPDGKICIGEGTTTSTYLPANNYFNYSLSQQIYTADEIGEAGAILSIDFFKAATTAMVKNLDIYMVSTTKDEFESTTDFIPVTASDLVFSGTVTFADNAWTTIELDNPFVYDGTSNVAIMVDNNTGDYLSSTPFYVFNSDKNQALYAQSDGTNYDPFAPAFTSRTAQKNRIRLAIGEPPACPKPTGLAVDYQGGNTATVTWEGEAPTYNIDVNGNVITGTSPYTLYDLQLATTYAVKVQANCGATDGLSEWTNAVNFTTDFCLPENMCQITLNLVDSYGDGWNGAAIGVFDYVDADNNTLLATFTVPSGSSSASYTLDVCDGRTLAFVWGAGNYDSECSYQILDHIGDEILSGSGALETTGYTMNCNSTCRKPTDLAATAGPRSATLSWTENGDATAWVLAYMASTDEDVTYVDVTTNPYVLEGLNTETTYYAMVRSDCDVDDKWSDAIAFTTLESCPAPSQLNITNLKPTSATVNWTGFSDTYDLRYAMAPTNSKRVATNNKPANNWKAKYVNYAPGAVKTKAPIVAFEAAPNSKPVVTTSNTRDGWLQYDDGTMVTGIGNGTTQYEWTWGVMYPASMLTGNDMLSKVSIYETAEYNTQDITINVYTGGDEAPETLVYTETVTPAGVDGFHEITFAEPVTIDPTQNLWITLTETGYYVIAACQGTESNNDWVDNGGWAHIGDVAASLAGYNWMIRGYLETSYDPETLDWTTVNGLNTNSYDITGLDPETTYIVQILGHCTEEDATTNWTQITFTTPSECENPENLTVVENTTGNSVTLGWDGYQESFNIKYRPATAVDPTVPATIILTADDVWEDGSGYQMLLDADANAYGELWSATHYIYVDGEQYTGGDIPDSYYANFEYKIPERANGALDTEFVVVTGSQTLQIPAGTYDFAIFNPTPGDRFYIAADNGNVGSAEDDFVFEPGATYEFVMQRIGSGDGAMLTVTRPMDDWETIENVEDIPYTLTGLTPETYYEWQVQGVNEDCTGLEWIDGPSFTTPEITTLTQTIELAAGTNWFSTYLEITLEDLEAALTPVLSALGNSATATIKNADYNIRYTRGRWGATPAGFVWDPAKMYIIQVSADIEFTLEGMPINPTDHPITIVNGNNWIGFPFNVSMTLTDAFTGFAINGDGIKDKDTNNRYARNKWSNTGLTTMEPGKGYIYISSSSEERTLIFPTAK